MKIDLYLIVREGLQLGYTTSMLRTSLKWKSIILIMLWGIEEISLPYKLLMSKFFEKSFKWEKPKWQRFERRFVSFSFMKRLRY